MTLLMRTDTLPEPGLRHPIGSPIVTAPLPPATATVPAAPTAAHIRRTPAPGVHLADLPPIGLPELASTGALLTRVDRKYLVPDRLVPVLLGRIRGSARALQIDGHRRFGYRTVYFDTPDLVSYLDATRRRRRRFKVRTRCYLDSGDCWLEVKTKDGRGRTVKIRRDHPAAAPDLLGSHEAAFLAAALRSCSERPTAVISRLSPVLTTHYQRATLFLPRDGARVTLDTGLVADDGASTLRIDGCTVVETKSGSSASEVDRVLWRLGQRPLKVSKYATCLAALRPDLPANKWLPALRRIAPPDGAAQPNSAAPPDGATPPHGADQPPDVPPPTPTERPH